MGLLFAFMPVLANNAAAARNPNEEQDAFEVTRLLFRWLPVQAGTEPVMSNLLQVTPRAPLSLSGHANV